METEGQEPKGGACGDLPLSNSLERDVGLAGPVGVDSHTSDGDGRGAGACEEGTREPRDVVLLHGHVEIALVEHVIAGIEGCNLQGNATLHLMEERVEVELLLGARGDIEGHRLLAVDATQTGVSIECARASGVVEPHFLNFCGDVIGEHKAAEGHDTVEGGLLLYRVFGNGDRRMIEERLRVALGVGELDLPQIGHRGVPIRAVTYDHQSIVARFQLEGGCSVIRRFLGLVDLFYTQTVLIVDGEIQACTGLRGRFSIPSYRVCCPSRKVLKRGLLDFEDRDDEVGVSITRGFIAQQRLLAGGEKQECA